MGDFKVDSPMVSFSPISVFAASVQGGFRTNLCRSLRPGLRRVPCQLAPRLTLYLDGMDEFERNYPWMAKCIHGYCYVQKERSPMVSFPPIYVFQRVVVLARTFVAAFDRVCAVFRANLPLA